MWSLCSRAPAAFRGLREPLLFDFGSALSTWLQTGGGDANYLCLYLNIQFFFGLGPGVFDNSCSSFKANWWEVSFGKTFFISRRNKGSHLSAMFSFTLAEIFVGF